MSSRGSRLSDVSVIPAIPPEVIAAQEEFRNAKEGSQSPIQDDEQSLQFVSSIFKEEHVPALLQLLKLGIANRAGAQAQVALSSILLSMSTFLYFLIIF